MSRPRSQISRRSFLQIAGASGLATISMFYGAGCSAPPRSVKSGKKMIVIGLDGFDPFLCEKLMDRGKLPNFARLSQAGGYARLGTSIPPQSPVAWANFITGADPGAHGIFDFIHRNPDKQCQPYFSASETVIPNEGWDIGDHRLPLPLIHSTTYTQLRREGTPFWEHLDAAGIPSWFYDIPSNYPPSPSNHGHHRCLTGMGTPDLLGSYGTYHYYSTRVRSERHEGGEIRKPLRFRDHVATGELTGPLNVLLKRPKATTAEFTVYRHPTEPTVRIDLQGQTILLKEGEWSQWHPVEFPLELPSFMPNDKVRGICRFLLQEVRPHFRLYVSPINIDPSAPAQQISEPHDFAQHISQELGLFPTAGFQEDHLALSNEIFSDEEYREQADYVLQERMNLLNYALDNWQDGLLFFYFSSTDLQAHMFWWDSDDPHPTRAPEVAQKYMHVVEDLYQRMDNVVGDLLQKYGDEATLFVLSDHGFCNFRRQFNVNTWLRQHGYLGPDYARSLIDVSKGELCDWSQTRAYALGLNGLYVNLIGRERDGIVPPADKDVLLEELRERLLAVKDPVTGQPAIARIDRADEVYHGPFTARAPDLIIGYNRGYRCSWDTALGTISDDVFSDNTSAWSADHCMAADQLPGVLFCNRPIRIPDPALVDLAPTILTSFGVTPPDTMTGRNFLT